MLSVMGSPTCELNCCSVQLRKERQRKREVLNDVGDYPMKFKILARNNKLGNVVKSYDSDYDESEKDKRNWRI